jgi:glycine dehydrogenase subunit 2
MPIIKDYPVIVTQEGAIEGQRMIAPCDVPVVDAAEYYKGMTRAEKAPLPNLPELQVLRHYTNLSLKNYGVENGTYPLGSCTMKYNPKVNEDAAALPGFAATHPKQPDETVQGSLELLYDLEQKLSFICGMDRFSFQPSAGAHGELLGLLLIKAYHESRGDTKRTVVIIPDAAHGTNPASAMMVGYTVREVKSNEDGMVDIGALEKALGDDVAGLMLTNPNTLGLFDKNIEKITQMVHDAGGLNYYDGANLNAITMQARPGDMGFDVVHLNVHKSFSTPHGGGGPGAGPVGLKKILEPFIPVPFVEKKDDGFRLVHDTPTTLGKVRGYLGSFGIFIRTYGYILANGQDGLKSVSEGAVANSTYLYERIKDHFTVPYPDGKTMHEFVITTEEMKKKYGVNTLDVAKRLIDYGFHPPTVYFPLVVSEAMMFEPTETETKEDLDNIAEALIKIAEEAKTDPDILHSAPHRTPIARPDETQAARNPILKA